MGSIQILKKHFPVGTVCVLGPEVAPELPNKQPHSRESIIHGLRKVTLAIKQPLSFKWTHLAFQAPGCFSENRGLGLCSSSVRAERSKPERKHAAATQHWGTVDGMADRSCSHRCLLMTTPLLGKMGGGGLFWSRM